jgi:hypothetical protein
MTPCVAGRRRAAWPRRRARGGVGERVGPVGGIEPAWLPAAMYRRTVFTSNPSCWAAAFFGTPASQSLRISLSSSTEPRETPSPHSVEGRIVVAWPRRWGRERLYKTLSFEGEEGFATLSGRGP